ncbi:hypothetical protein [Pseudomonas sp. UW4]|uniref:hypothetical protein n=1 Tax=Pseudomonas sp. UW4 TaxID=1207075 RepID=UPI00029CDF91|nr:hypothetical protein [Pseudomonas sp. UW4]AFY20782.1 hypothetical protein PputUW4_03590 [Pseudomonas sp. UW4]
MNRANERVELLITLHKGESSKLDHFILGVTLAICAYLAQTNPYAQLGVNKETFLLCSLLVFAASAICGFKRLEATIESLRLNAIALQQEDPRLRTHLLEKVRERKAPSRYYWGRNYLLAAGLLCYLATKVWATYQNNGWIPVH